MAQIGSILGLVDLLLHIIHIMYIKKNMYLSLDRNFNLWVLLLMTYTRNYYGDCEWCYSYN